MNKREEAFYSALGKMLKHKREESGLTLAHVATNTLHGMSRANLSMIELGKVRVGVHQLFLLDKLYGGVIESMPDIDLSQELEKIDGKREILKKIKELKDQLT